MAKTKQLSTNAEFVQQLREKARSLLTAADVLEQETHGAQFQRTYNPTKTTGEPTKKTRRVMSPEVRAKLAESQRARWAKTRELKVEKAAAASKSKPGVKKNGTAELPISE